MSETSIVDLKNIFLGLFLFFALAGLAMKLFRMADKDNDGETDIDEMMNFVIVLTKPR